MPGVTLAFMIGLMRRRAVAGEMLGRLSVALSRPLDARQLRARLATALDDPTLDMLVPDGVPGRWRDSAGRVVARPSQAGPRRSRRSPIGPARSRRSCTTPRCGTTTELLEAVRALVLVTVAARADQDELAARSSELEDSRKRIARAADLERSRIERDLHDGAQQRLIGLRIRLALAEELTQDRPRGGRGGHARRSATRSIARWRSCARSRTASIPRCSSDRGLVDALRSVTAQCPLPAHL